MGNKPYTASMERSAIELLPDLVQILPNSLCGPHQKLFDFSRSTPLRRWNHLCCRTLTTAVMSSVPDNAAGIASAVNNALTRFASLLAVSLLSLVMAHGFEASLDAQLDRSGLPI